MKKFFSLLIVIMIVVALSSDGLPLYGHMHGDSGGGHSGGGGAPPPPPRTPRTSTKTDCIFFFN